MIEPRFAAFTVPEDGRDALASRFQAVRRQTIALASQLSPEDQLIQSMPDTSPTKWHLAHTTWFFESFVLVRLVPGYTAFDDRFAYLFNSSFEHWGAQLPKEKRGLLSRPSSEEIARYRDQINALLIRRLDQLSDTEWPEAARLIEMGIRHEQQHQELILADIKHAFWSCPVQPPYREPATSAPGLPGPERWFDHPGGPVAIGRDRGEGGHVCDHETPRHTAHLAPFRISGRLVTCGEYLAFMSEGGYDRPSLWLADGWELVQSEGWRAPLYWRKQGGEWRTYSLSGTYPVDPAEPVCHVSYYEADAYARWAGRRLPTEIEWEAVASQCQTSGNLLDGGGLHPRISHCASDGPWQMFGDVWEWTTSPFAPYPGYRPPARTPAENHARFMVNRMVARGGSCCTPADYIRATTRHFLAPNARWQFTGIRLAEDG